MRILRRALLPLVAAAATIAIACSSSSGGGSGTSCVLEDDAGDRCLCFFGAPAAGARVVTNCSVSAFPTATCCADNGWPSNASGDAICECSPTGSGCPNQVPSCSATTTGKDGG
jgi:hypothetical protein